MNGPESPAARRLLVNEFPYLSIADRAAFSEFDRKLASMVSASARVRVFLAGRFLWTQSAASSGDLRLLSSEISWSRSVGAA
jgi:hypothetical protein